MKYTIHGFSQQKAIEYGLDDRDLMILRWFIDYKDTGKMARKIIDDDMYYWIKYDGIIETFPIVSWKKDTVYRRLRGMADKGILKHKTLKQGGIWSYYTVGPNYIYLTDTNGEIEIEVGNKSEGIGNKSEGIGNKSEGIGNKSGTKNSSIINTSIINTSITTTTNGDSDFNIFRYAEMRNFILSAIQIQQLQNDINTYSLEEVKKALDIADDNGKHTYSYVKGILQKRRANGETEVNKDGTTSKPTENTKSEEPQYKFDF